MAAIMIIKLIIANDKVLITPIPNKKNGIPTIKTILKIIMPPLVFSA